MTAWLVIAGDSRQHAGNLGYDDEPASRYTWDDTFANHGRPATGDIIVLGDKKVLIGLSVIEGVKTWTGSKRIHRCVNPDCATLDLKPRATRQPLYRCSKCHAEFDDPAEEWTKVTKYRTDHASGWINLEGRMSWRALRDFCLKPKSSLSIRELDWTALRETLEQRHPLDRLDNVTWTEGRTSGAHSKATVRVRTGQARFRKQMFKKYGNVCALTGPQPLQALDAVHLCSYASVGEHHEHGGLLLRADVHRLFDLGLIGVGVHGAIDVLPELNAFPSYAKLHSGRIYVDTSDELNSWFRKHWEQHRGGSGEPGQITNDGPTPPVQDI